MKIKWFLSFKDVHVVFSCWVNQQKVTSEYFILRNWDKTFQRYAKTWRGYHCSTKGRLSSGESWLEKMSLPRFGERLKVAAAAGRTKLANVHSQLCSFNFKHFLTRFFRLFSQFAMALLISFSLECLLVVVPTVQPVWKRCISIVLKLRFANVHTFSFHILIKEKSRTNISGFQLKSGLNAKHCQRHNGPRV